MPEDRTQKIAQVTALLLGTVVVVCFCAVLIAATLVLVRGILG